MTFFLKKIKFLILLISFILLFPIITEAVSYQPLAPIPNVAPVDFSKGDTALSNYLNNLYKLLVGVAGVLAVIMIMWGGIEYMSTDAIGGKEEAKSRINNALLGLMIALGSFLILQTINSQFLNTTLKIKSVTAPTLVVYLEPPPSGSRSTSGTQSQVEDQYNKIYAQWTDADDEALYNGSQLAADKWDSIQLQIDALNNKYTKQPASGSANVGTANQKILNQIASGDTSCSAHCFSSAEDLARNAGVTYSSVFQNHNYVVGGKTQSSFGSARMPVAGEMVDVYTGGAAATGYPFHTVILDHYDSSGKAIVWDWKNNAKTGLRTMDFTLDNSQATTKGYVGRIYVPK